MHDIKHQISTLHRNQDNLRLRLEAVRDIQKTIDEIRSELDKTEERISYIESMVQMSDHRHGFSETSPVMGPSVDLVEKDETGDE